MSIRELLVYPIINSQNLHHKNCMTDRKENYLGSERVKKQKLLTQQKTVFEELGP